MTHHPMNDKGMASALELLSEQGLSGLGKAIEILLSMAMEVERERHLQASPYERTEQRQGYANGFKPKTVNSRLGPLSLRVPQVSQGQQFG